MYNQKYPVYLRMHTQNLCCLLAGTARRTTNSTRCTYRPVACRYCELYNQKYPVYLRMHAELGQNGKDFLSLEAAYKRGDRHEKAVAEVEMRTLLRQRSKRCVAVIVALCSVHNLFACVGVLLRRFASCLVDKLLACVGVLRGPFASCSADKLFACVGTRAWTASSPSCTRSCNKSSKWWSPSKRPTTSESVVKSQRLQGCTCCGFTAGTEGRGTGESVVKSQ